MSPSVLLFSVIAACTEAPSDDSTDTADTADTSSTARAENGLPEGESSWEGPVELAGSTFLLALALENDGGDLSGVATFSDHPDQPVGLGSGTYSVTGTHEPGSGLLVIAPGSWIQQPNVNVELLGLSAIYDPEAGTLNGTAADYASGSDNTLQGGPALLSWVSGDGAPTAFGDRSRELPEGTRAFSGTHQCTSAERELAGELSYEGAGRVSGTISFGDLTLSESTNTFAFSGVHNPSTGGITLAPGLYTQTDRTYLGFFVEATYDPATDRFDGGGRTNQGPCDGELWKAGF